MNNATNNSYPTPPWPPQLPHQSTPRRSPINDANAAFLTPNSAFIRQHIANSQAPQTNNQTPSSAPFMATSTTPIAAASTTSLTSSDEQYAAQLQREYEAEAARMRQEQEQRDHQLAQAAAAAFNEEDAEEEEDDSMPPLSYPSIKMRTPEEMARLNLARALDMEAEAKLLSSTVERGSYRQQMRREIQERKKAQKAASKKPNKKKGPEYHQQRAVERAARLARRQALRERELRLEDERVRGNKTGGVGNVNQWGTLSSMIEPSASESESDDENENETNDQGDETEYPNSKRPKLSHQPQPAARVGANESQLSQNDPTSTVPMMDVDLPINPETNSSTPQTHVNPAMTSNSLPVVTSITAAHSNQQGHISNMSLAMMSQSAGGGDVNMMNADVTHSGGGFSGIGTSMMAAANNSNIISSAANPMIPASAGGSYPGVGPSIDSSTRSSPVIPSNQRVPSSFEIDRTIGETIELLSSDDDSEVEIVSFKPGAPPSAQVLNKSNTNINTLAMMGTIEGENSKKAMREKSNQLNHGSNQSVTTRPIPPGVRNTNAVPTAAAASSSRPTFQPSFQTPGKSTYVSPLNIPGKKKNKPPNSATTSSQPRSSTPPSKPSSSSSSVPLLASSLTSSSLYLPPPDPAFINPFSGEVVPKPAPPPPPKSKKRPRAQKSTNEQKLRKQELIRQGIITPDQDIDADDDRRRHPSYAAAVAASTQAAVAVAAASNARTPLSKDAKYRERHGKALAVPDTTPFNAALYFTAEELSALQSDWSSVRHVILLDLDNWTGFFKRLTYSFSDDVYLWVFHGQNTTPRISRHSIPFLHLRDRRHIQFTRCGVRPDAADFALMLKLGELNQLCAKDIPFTLFSGDRGFDETLVHITDRRVQRVDPHLAGTDEETFALLKSIADT